MLGCIETNLIPDVDVLQKYPNVVKYTQQALMNFHKRQVLCFDVVKYSTIKQLFAFKAIIAQIHSFFLAKLSIFNILINLHAICKLHIVQQIEVFLLDPVHHIIHSISLASDCTGLHQPAPARHSWHHPASQIQPSIPTRPARPPGPPGPPGPPCPPLPPGPPGPARPDLP